MNLKNRPAQEVWMVYILFHIQHLVWKASEPSKPEVLLLSIIIALTQKFHNHSFIIYFVQK